MKKFIRKNFTKKQRAKIYRFLYTLNAIDFSFLQPVVIATLLFIAAYIGITMPEEAILQFSELQILLYYFILVFLTAALIIFIRPFVHHRILRIRIWFYRRRKKPTYSIFS